MRFEVPVPSEVHPLYLAGQAGPSYVATGFGLYLPLAEGFIVKSLRRVMGLIRDKALKEEVERLCAQEAHHAHQHERFNAFVVGRSYPALAGRIQRLREDFVGMLDHQDDKFRVGVVEGKTITLRPKLRLSRREE